MQSNQNRQIGSAPNLPTEEDFSHYDTKLADYRSVPATFLHTSVNTQNMSIEDAISTQAGSFSELQENEDLFRQTLNAFHTLHAPENIAQATLLGPIEHNTMFSTMKVVPQDMEKLKEDLSYYQYKLYQRFSIKVTDLVRLETLGKGAFGEVTRVFNKTDRKFYALKEIKRQSFKKPIYFESAVWTEIQNLLKVTELHDPSLLKTVMIDFDEDEETCYMLMELGGGTLEEYADYMKHYELVWSESKLLYILYQLVSQILKLKQVNMYHRDIKPSNVIISPKQGAFKLGDVGCACITKEGVQKLDIAGTPRFMSPELTQAIMRREMFAEHDPYLSDLYSLGITMLTLLDPGLKKMNILNFMEGTVKTKYPNLYSILRDFLGKPERRADGVEKTKSMKQKIQEYKIFEDGDLGEKYRLYLYLKIISKNKDIDTSFYFDMFILDDALLVINEKLDLLAKDAKPDEENLEEINWKVRRARCYYMQMNYEAAIRELTELMGRKEMKSFDPRSALVKANVLFWLGLAKVPIGRRFEAIENLMHCLGIRVAEYGEVHEDVSAVFWLLGDIKTRQENFPGAIKAFQKCIEIGEKLDFKERHYMTKSLNNLGMIAELRGEHEKALQLFERAKETAIETHGENHPAVADQFLAIAYVYIILGRGEEGLEMYEKALGIKRRWYGENNPEVADAYTRIAQGYDRLGEYNKVLKLLSKSMAIRKNVNGDESQELADVYQMMGSVLCKEGQYLKSFAYANKVINIKQKHLGENSPRLAPTYIWHAETCSALNLENEKQKSLEKFLAIDFDKVELNIDNMKVGFRAVRLLAEEGKIEKAWEYVEKGYQMCINIALSKATKTFAYYYEAVGRLRWAEGNHELALENLKRAISIRDNLPSKDPDIEADLYSLLGDIYETLGNNEEALEWRRKCVSMTEAHLSKGSQLMVKAVVELATTLQKLGKDEEGQLKVHEAKLLIKKIGISKHHVLSGKVKELEKNFGRKPNINLGREFITSHVKKKT